jgi:D-alanyl-D-alanine carboxypeptidase
VSRLPWLLSLLCLLLLAPTPVQAAPDDFPVYSGDQFKALYDYAIAEMLPDLEPPIGEVPITGDTDLDARIWQIALDRGYVPRPVAGAGLSSADGIQMQPQAAEAWLQLKESARAAGLGFVVSSAYRSPESQRSHFNSKLEGTSDDAINAALTWYSIPGTSKHHSGYALDFRYTNGTFGEFRDTPDYAWLAADNFYNAKRFGFIPSYPDGVTIQGPNPEPWEFVWVGVDLIRCGIPLELDPTLFGSNADLARQFAACPGTAAGQGMGNVFPYWLLRMPAVGAGVRL